MHFKGTIVITDPCYIVKKCAEKNPHPFPWTTVNIKNPNINEMVKQYSEWEDTHDDWRKCQYGENMGVLGIHNYISESTIYGDWGCTTYQTEEEPKELLENILRVLNDNLENEECGDDELPIPDEGKAIGGFCADAGLVGVFLLDEILAYNPDWKSWIEEHSWCATIIKDFEGEVEYYIDKVYKEAHIVGTGSINFYTTQTSI